MTQEINLKVNGRIHRVFVAPDTPLIYFLRNDLGLKGTKFGCGLGQCGACKILVDGKVVHSCRISVESVLDRDITTVEGIGSAEELHPVQEAFIEEQAVQCGFCTPGMLMTTRAFLNQNPNPSETHIRKAISGNICRCTGYSKIVEAIMEVAGGGTDT